MRRDESRLDDAIADAVELDRRTVNRAMAWSVPVVMAAVAAPAATGSGTTTTPTVSFTQKTATLDPATGAISFSLTLSSTAAGQIRFTLLDGATAQGLPYVTAIAAGTNSLSFSVTKPGATATSVTLTYTVDNGVSYQTVQVPVTSPTTYVSGTAQKNASQKSATFTLTFSGSASSKISISNVSSTGETWSGWPTTPQSLTASGSQLTMTFTANRTASANTQVTITYSIDGGAAKQTPQITV